VKAARVYLRVSTDAQDLERQEDIIARAKSAGYYVAGVYREKASGARADRPELLRMVAGLQPGEVVIAEKIDRISRLPLAEAERLVASIRKKGARLAIPGVVDLSDLAAATEGVSKIVLEDVQTMLLRLALRKEHSIARTAELAGCSASTVKMVCRKAQTRGQRPFTL
jgi:DNA invertase Pin-like site-specific DNA recombinase